MKTIDQTMLSDMAINMLERTAMVLAEPAANESDNPTPTRFARIVFRGPTCGSLVLGATDGFLRELAAGLLGAEPSEVDVDSQGNDALKEMANMLGGSVILALSGETCEYSLGLPELISAAPSPLALRSACTVVGESGVLRLMLGDAPLAKAA